MAEIAPGKRMADIVLDHHSWDGKLLTLTGRVPEGGAHVRVHAALLPPTGDDKPLAEATADLDAAGRFTIELPIAAGTAARLTLTDADQPGTFWIGSGAPIPPGWVTIGDTRAGAPGALGTPGGAGVPGAPGGPGTPGIPDAAGAPGLPGTPGGPGVSGTPGGPDVPGKPGGPGSNGTPVPVPPGTPNFPVPDPKLPGGNGKPGKALIPCLCALLPASCSQLLGAWKSLLLLGIGLLYCAIALFPPDWGPRTVLCILTDEVLNAERLVRVTATSGGGAVATAAPVGGAAGGGGGAVLGGPVGAAVGAAVTAAVNAVASGTGGAIGGGGGEISDQQALRIVRGAIGLADGIVVLFGEFLRILAEIVLTVALAILLAWFICCARGDLCRLISNLAWVLEAAIIIVVPVLGMVVGGVLLVLTFLPPAACARVGTQWFLNLAAGLLLGTIIYGFVRWRRDRGRCPILVLWQWPWTEYTP